MMSTMTVLSPREPDCIRLKGPNRLDLYQVGWP